MPRGYRYVVFTASGLIGLCLLGIGYEVGRNSDRQRYYQNAQETPAAITQRQHTEQYQKKCDNSTDWDEASACAAISQAYSAITANEQARDDSKWNHASFFVGLITLAVAGAAALYTCFAWKEAKRGSDKAEISAGAAVASHKAFVAAEDANLVVYFDRGIYVTGTDGQRYGFAIHVKNIGKAPCNINWLECDKEPVSITQPFVVGTGEDIPMGRSYEITKDKNGLTYFDTIIRYDTAISESKSMTVTSYVHHINDATIKAIIERRVVQ